MTRRKTAAPAMVEVGEAAAPVKKTRQRRNNRTNIESAKKKVAKKKVAMSYWGKAEESRQEEGAQRRRKLPRRKPREAQSGAHDVSSSRMLSGRRPALLRGAGPFAF